MYPSLISHINGKDGVLMVRITETISLMVRMECYRVE